MKIIKIHNVRFHPLELLLCILALIFTVFKTGSNPYVSAIYSLAAMACLTFALLVRTRRELKEHINGDMCVSKITTILPGK